MAIACFRNATILNPQYIDAHYNLGVSLAKQSVFEPAIVCFQKAINLDPEYADAYFNFGLVLISQDRYQEAVSYFQKSLELSPQDFEYRIALDNALRAKKI